MRPLKRLTSVAAVGLGIGLPGCVADNVEALGNREAAEGFEEGESASFVSPPPSPPPEDVYIESILASGPGCPGPGDVPTFISLDHQWFLVTFNRMFLSYPPAPLVKNLSCTVGLTIHFPAGWQFALTTVTMRGYAYLSEGMRARHTRKYFFDENPGPPSRTTLNGPYDGAFTLTDTIVPTAWSHCGGMEILVIETSINLDALGNPDGVGMINTDGVDNVLRESFQWAWRAC